VQWVLFLGELLESRESLLAPTSRFGRDLRDELLVYTLNISGSTDRSPTPYPAKTPFGAVVESPQEQDTTGHNKGNEKECATKYRPQYSPHHAVHHPALSHSGFSANKDSRCNSAILIFL
jgi:hypothetical protein